MKHIVLALTCLFVSNLVSAQTNYKYWVQFSSKYDTAYSFQEPSKFLSLKAIQRRLKHHVDIDSTDLPVKQSFIDSVLSKGVTLHSKSRWFNAITVKVPDTSVMQTIRQLPFVKKVEKTYVPNLTRSVKIQSKKFSLRKVTVQNNGYGNAFTQINIHNGTWLHQAGFKGEGIQIAVLDAGFLNVNSNPAFAQARSNGQILGTKDFVNPSSDIYAENYHGGQVLSVMAANEYDKFIGTAPDASYWLIRTEDNNSEFPVEGDNMVAGMEFADSVGADIITTSLGYFNYDDTTMSLKYKDLNGKTCRASIAQTLSARKGMVVVSSAGNEGANPWHYLTAPADADSIITVGSVTTSLERSSFSGFGPTSDGRIKPTVCALGTNTAVINELGDVSTNNGTSLSTPIITGLTACLWQALPSLTNMQIVELIKKHSTKYETPDNELGYGIPDFYAAYMDASGVGNKSLSSVDLVRVFPNPVKDTLSMDVDPSIIGRNPELIIYAVNGKKIFKKELIEINEKISLDKIPQGNYTLTVLLGRVVILKQQLIKE